MAPAFDITIHLVDWTRWKNGTHIQHAFPYLTPGERELLSTHLCSKCFDKLFGEEEN